MNGLLDCCSPCCATVVNVQIPGPEGASGTNGAAGTNGGNSYTISTANFVVPAVGANVTVSVADSSWMVVGEKVVVQGPATFQVISLPTVNSAVLKFMGYVDDVAVGTTIVAGAAVGPSGSQPSVSGFATIDGAGNNSDIHQLTGLTTALSITQGGTGGTSGSAARTNLGVSRVTQDYIELREIQAAGVDGGAFNNGAARTRAINTEVVDTGGHAAILGGGQFSLAAGTYRFRIFSVAYEVDSHVAWLQNITDAVTVAIGDAARSAAASDCNTVSMVTGRFTIAGTKTFEVQAQAQTTKAVSGFGKAVNLGKAESYCIAVFEREAN